MTVVASFEQERMVATSKAVSLAARRIADAGRPLPNIVLSSHLEAKLAGWAVMLRDAGFGVCVSPSNPASTIADQARRLASERIPVLDWDPRTPSQESFWSDLRAFDPEIILDDGALLIEACSGRRDLPGLRAAVEFTTSGHDNLSNGTAVKDFAVLDVGLSYCKYELGNVYGTGVSALVAVSEAANVHLAAKHVLVIGYGAVGRSVANAARSLGANVAVSDSKVRNVARAHFDGHDVGELGDLLPKADLVLTCSGARSSLDADMLVQLPDNAIVANVGCFADEIDIAGLRLVAETTVRRDRQIETFVVAGGKRLHVLANAELVNLAIGRGWPIELIDLCFALSTLCFAELCTEDLAPGLHGMPDHLDDQALALFLSGA